MQVTLKSGEVFIVDLTGAQYGHYKPILPLKIYLEQRANSVHEGFPLWFRRSKIVRGCEGNLTWPDVIRKSTERVYKYFNAVVMEWQDTDMLLPTMLRMKEDPYLAACKRLTIFVQESVTSWMKQAERGRITPYLVENNPTRVSEEQEPDLGGISD